MPQNVRRESLERDPGSLEGHRLYVVRSAIDSTLRALPNQPGLGDAVRDGQDRTALGYDAQSDYPPVHNLVNTPVQPAAIGEVATHAYPDTPAAPTDVVPFSHLQPAEDFPPIDERSAA